MRSLDRWIVFDLETVGRDDVDAFIAPPEAAKNLKDPAKIAADLESKAAEQREKLSLDWNLNRIVAIGWQVERMTESHIETVSGLDLEASLLSWFWDAADDRRLIGFRARTFDLPVLIQRSRILGISHPMPNLARFGKGDVDDLSDLLTFDDMPCAHVMRRTLTNFCRLLGVDCPEDGVEGKDIPRLVAEGQWEAIRTHVRADVAKTLGLAKRLGVVSQMQPETVF